MVTVLTLVFMVLALVAFHRDVVDFVEAELKLTDNSEGITVFVHTSRVNTTTTSPTTLVLPILDCDGEDLTSGSITKQTLGDPGSTLKLLRGSGYTAIFTISLALLGLLEIGMDSWALLLAWYTNITIRDSQGWQRWWQRPVAIKALLSLCLTGLLTVPLAVNWEARTCAVPYVPFFDIYGLAILTLSQAILLLALVVVALVALLLIRCMRRCNPGTITGNNSKCFLTSLIVGLVMCMAMPVVGLLSAVFARLNSIAAFLSFLQFLSEVTLLILNGALNLEWE